MGWLVMRSGSADVQSDSRSPPKIQAPVEVRREVQKLASNYCHLELSWGARGTCICRGCNGCCEDAKALILLSRSEQLRILYIIIMISGAKLKVEARLQMTSEFYLEARNRILKILSNLSRQLW